LTYVFQDVLRMLVTNALTHFTTGTAVSHMLGTIRPLTQSAALRNAGGPRGAQA
jgi:hypothetical protein